MQRPSSSLIVLGLFTVTLGGSALMVRGIYGIALFFIVPMFLGAFAALLLRARSAGEAAWIGAGAVFVANLCLLATGGDGMICIVMALPITLVLGAVGGSLGYKSLDAKGSVAMMLILPVGALGFDVTASPPVYEIQSSIDIQAPAAQVWKHVVAFAKMPEPSEWYFHTGLAYPTAARIEGAGPGATRYCDLSTGPVVETVEIWDEPRLLRFRVIQTPVPMREWSFYGEVSPKHLRGYMVSKEGQFRLIALGPNQTRVVGTSWYQHGLWPAQYWRLWSDAIIRRIHRRVLNHIRTLAEAENARAQGFDR